MLKRLQLLVLAALVLVSSSATAAGWTGWRRSWIPRDLPGAGLVLELRADVGVIPHTTLRAAGTSPPAATLTYTGTQTYALHLACDSVAGGTARGQATFKWSLDGGSTYQATGVLTAASVILGTTGYTIAFPTGVFNVNQTWDTTTRTWNDQSGAGNNADQATAGNQGLINAGVVAAGKPSVLIDPNLSNSYTFPSALATPFSGTAKPVTLIVAVKLTVANRTGPIIGLADVSNGEMRFRIHTSTSHIGAFRKNDAAASVTVATTDTQTTTAQYTSFVYSGTTISVFLNGAATSLSNTALAPAGAVTLSNARLGADGNFAAENMWGDVSHIYMFTTALSATDRARTEFYVKAQAGL